MSSEGEAMSNPYGRPRDLVRDAWAIRFGMSYDDVYRLLTVAMMNQLSRCKSDECRRLILGISEQYHDGEGPLLTDALMVL
jgi:hypothetical protein